MKKRVAGIIGCGKIAENLHIPTLLAMDFTISWIIDKPSLSVKKIAEYLKADFFDFISLKEIPPADYILIAAPFGTREGYYKLLQNNTSAIYIEKPIALSTNQHLAIQNLRNDYAIAAGYNKKTKSNLAIVKDIIENDFFGKVERINIESGGFGITTGGRYNSNLQLAGGGILFETTVHSIDAINFIFNVVDVSVTNSKMLFDSGIDIHTEAEYQIKVAETTDWITCKVLATHLKQNKNNITIHFCNADLSFSVFSDMPPILHSNNGKSELALSNKMINEISKPYEVNSIFWRDFIRAVETQKVNYTNLSSTLNTTKIIEGLYSKGGRIL